jgi:hypothetical protein
LKLYVPCFFLWVYLVFDYLKQGFRKTEKGVDASIANLPESVNHAYDKILDKSKDQQKARKVLAIILAASRPLTLKEMNIAVNVESFSVCTDDLNLEEETDFSHTLRDWCGLFVSIYHGKVHFLHQTAREFLLSTVSVSGPISLRSSHWYGSISLEQAHSVLAKACIAYPNFNDPEDKALSDGNGEQYFELAFFQYSAMNWTLHLHQAHIENEKEVIPIVLRICDLNRKRSRAWFTVYWPDSYTDERRLTDPITFIVVSYLGINRAVQWLLDNEVDVNSQNRHGDTALFWTANNGHEALVRLLLESEADVNLQNSDGTTALSWAVLNGDEAVVRLLNKWGNKRL